MSEWQGKVAVITGAASGIGAGLARCCVARGMRVVASDIDEAGLKSLAEGLGVPDALHTLRLDVTEETELEQLAARVFEDYGEVNLLFNNAGVLVDGKSWERSSRDWRWNIDVNVMGVIHGLQAFVPRMLAQGSAGRIINTSSIGGLLGGGAYLAPYQGTKHMVTAITESLYQELEMEDAPFSASVLCPAEVNTGIWESDRLRPSEQHNVLGSEGERQLREAIATGVAAGLDPDDFAVRVFEGIEAGKFWLLPQPEFKQQFELRHQSIVGETNPVSMLELLGLQ